MNRRTFGSLDDWKRPGLPVRIKRQQPTDSLTRVGWPVLEMTVSTSRPISDEQFREIVVLKQPLGTQQGIQKVALSPVGRSAKAIGLRM